MKNILITLYLGSILSACDSQSTAASKTLLHDDLLLVEKTYLDNFTYECGDKLLVISANSLKYSISAYTANRQDIFFEHDHLSQKNIETDELNGYFGSYGSTKAYIRDFKSKHWAYLGDGWFKEDTFKYNDRKANWEKLNVSGGSSEFEFSAMSFEKSTEYGIFKMSYPGFGHYYKIWEPSFPGVENIFDQKYFKLTIPTLKEACSRI